ncbi:MAG: sodium-translocating pyrophosphatase [Flavobacteriales bacterium]|nr:sodium-translocating pyrophosphatase [Flavobacteriales bacterium]MDP4730885.1 sodium-translocating pyrophosphatase [Flavobacteriales bacterium]MDP4818851.1 sodium-translocating pyrophosphatase [Flavobacteriales bacterium]
MGNLQWGDIVLYSIPALGLLGILFMAIKSAWVTKQDAGDENMQELAGYIAKGAMAFLKAEWKVLAYFVVIAGALLAWSGTLVETSSPIIAISFIIGAVLSALAGYIGMNIATKANVRTTQAARTSLAQALKVSFTGGSVMGLGVAGLAVIGLGSLFILLYTIYVKSVGASVNGVEMEKALEVLAGFSLGAESIALFARVGGGIYTKAADVGADLVGKVEAGIPEDDVRNPATIADNVGDNVGDVAGMGADLFGSYVATILATMVLGRELISKDDFGGIAPILLPMLIAGLGIVFSIIGMMFVRVKDEMGNVQNALNLGNWSSIILTAVASFFIVNWMLPETMSWTDSARGVEVTRMGVFWAIMVGLVVGALMSIITEYYTAMGKRPVMSIIKQSATGHATNIIGGLSVGMESTVLPILVLAAGIYGSYEFAGLYGVAIAAAGMMATTAMQLAIDAFGPIADNAGGIAEMSQLPEEVRHRTDNLDAVGNTTAATGKGFAIASAALTSLALFAAFVGIAGIDAIDIYKAPVLAGLFVGGMIPFIFSSLAIAAVGRAAMDMVNEVRRQFREIPGIMEYKAKPEYEKCVAISTEASIREMIAPGAIALITPVIVGFIFGPEVLGGLLAGVTVSGVLMGMFQSNAGGAWDNAKKSFEKGVEINGEMFYKKSEPHKASVTGDTVGDPFKDTSGPSMNILIKLMSIVALVIAPHISEKGHGGTAATVALTSTNDSLSFALGLAIGENMHRMEIDSLINYNIFEKAANGAAGMEMEEAQMFLDNYFQRREKAKLASVKTKETAVIDSIKKNTPGIQVEESGLMYVVTQEGAGAYATEQDSVQVEYVGKLMNGQIFDSSDAGKPVTFNLGGLIPGFTEGLQKVKEGGKIRLFIPSALAYRDMDQGPIPPYSTLMFDITLVKVYSKK